MTIDEFACVRNEIFEQSGAVIMTETELFTYYGFNNLMN